MIYAPSSPLPPPPGYPCRHQVCAVVGGGRASVFVDGREAASAPLSVDLSGSNLRVGQMLGLKYICDFI